MRPAQPEDASFLFQLFAESQEQLAALQSNEALWRSLVEMQYRGRKMTYAAQYPEAEDSILLGDGEEPVGRLLVDRKVDCWRIVDIAVLAAHRGRGLGTSVLKECQRQAAAAGAGLELQVAPFNPARRLYERLGFEATRENAVAAEMVWSLARQRQAR